MTWFLANLVNDIFSDIRFCNDERYISRFSMGLIADIQPPSYETRYAILQKLNGQHNNIFNDEVLSYISTNVDTDIRSLEGAYKNVIQYARIYGIKDITIEHVNEAIKEYISFNKKYNQSFSEYGKNRFTNSKRRFIRSFRSYQI